MLFHDSAEPHPLEVADTFVEKSIVGTLMAIDALSYVSPFRWIPHLAGCGTEEAQTWDDFDSAERNTPPRVPSEDHGETTVPEESIPTANEPLVCEEALAGKPPEPERCNGLDDDCDGEILHYKRFEAHTLGEGYFREWPVTAVWTGDSILALFHSTGLSELIVRLDAQGNILSQTQLFSPYNNNADLIPLPHLVVQMIWTGTEGWLLIDWYSKAAVIRIDENGNFIGSHETDSGNEYTTPIKIFPTEEGGYLLFGFQQGFGETSGVLKTFSVDINGTITNVARGGYPVFTHTDWDCAMQSGIFDIVKKENQYVLFGFDRSLNLYKVSLNEYAEALEEPQILVQSETGTPPSTSCPPVGVNVTYGNGRYLVAAGTWSEGSFNGTRLYLENGTRLDEVTRFNEELGNDHPRHDFAWNGTHFILTHFRDHGLDVSFFDPDGNRKQRVEVWRPDPLGVFSITTAHSPENIWLLGTFNLLDGEGQLDHITPESVEFARIGRCDALLP